MIKQMLRSRKMSFDQTGVFILVLMVVVWLGFGPSYFNRILDTEFPLRFHFHATCMVIWIVSVLVQPFFIRTGKIKLHKIIGRLSYALFPIMILSTLILIHGQLKMSTQVYGADFFIPMKDVIVMVLAFPLAIRWKENVAIHSRLMVVCMIPMIEPSLVRMLVNLLPTTLVDQAYLLTLLTVDGLIIALLLNDRNKPHARWVFPVLLGYMVLVQAVIYQGWTEVFWIVGAAQWFASL